MPHNRSGGEQRTEDLRAGLDAVGTDNPYVFVLVWLGAPFVFGLVLSALFARRSWHFLVLLALGLLLGFGLLLYAYLVAPPEYSQSNGCSDCEEYLGRWWEPLFVLYVAIFATLAYWVGIAMGALVALFVRAARRPRPTA